MSRIKLLSLWFGDLPAWINKFRERLAANPGVDWQIVTPASLSEVQDLVLRRTGYECGKDSVRAITCDLRPAFGEMFTDLYAGAEWWGWCDLDMVFGDMRRFLTDDVLESADVISDGGHGINGPFTILRNTQDVRAAYRSAAFKDQCARPEHVAWDEVGFTDLVAELGMRTSYNAWSGHDSKEAKCRLDGKRLIETDHGREREIFAYHFCKSKWWPL